HWAGCLSATGRLARLRTLRSAESLRGVPDDDPAIGRVHGAVSSQPGAVPRAGVGRVSGPCARYRSQSVARSLAWRGGRRAELAADVEPCDAPAADPVRSGCDAGLGARSLWLATGGYPRPASPNHRILRRL